MAGDVANGVNWIFLVWMIVASLLSSFFVLYFNRVFASIISWALRTYSWHQYRVYIDIQALQVSLLAGRVFFTGLRYHGDNETILIQHGFVTWSYWLRRVRSVSIGKEYENEKDTNGKAFADEAGRQGGARGGTSRLPCRVNVSLVGLEWFIYNRSPAYEYVKQRMMEDDILDTGETTGVHEKEATSDNLRQRRSHNSEGHTEPPGTGSTETRQSAKNRLLRSKPDPASHAGQQRPSSVRSNSPDEAVGDKGTADDEMPMLLQLLPIHFQCEKAAMVIGNENTKAILVMKTDSVDGEIDACATDTIDPYRQLFKMKFQRPTVDMVDNEDFKEDQADRAARERHVAQQSEPIPKQSLFTRQRRKIYGTLRNHMPFLRKSVESFAVDYEKGGSGDRGGPPLVSHIPGINHWQGLSRYLDQDDDDRSRWTGTEYAAISNVVDSTEASMVVYWDAVGKVARQPTHTPEATGDAHHDINGEKPPAWGINISLKGGSVTYGPWADRQRADLQRVFAPSLCKDAVPARPLAEGSFRVPTKFKLLIELENDVVLRLPHREESKNWRWKGQDALGDARRSLAGKPKAGLRSKKKEAATTVRQRPYGWLDVKIAANATIAFEMDMVAGDTGYSMDLRVDLPAAEISTSVNHQLLLRSGPQRIVCDLSTPLKWNAPRQWLFDIDCQGLELFILRDHIFLLVDLVDDWASGPPVDYLVFTPFKYCLNLSLRDLKLYLNINDANIINNPTDLEDNAFIILSSPLLEANTCIPIDKYRPPRNAIPFDVKTDLATVALHLPPWNTQAPFLASKEIAQGENLNISGAYHYNATTSTANTDTLVLDLSAQSPSAKLYGFLIRYFLKLKDNYFGDDVHFKTLEEYQELLRLKQTNPEAELHDRPPPKKSNDLDVILTIRADDPKVMLPANLYSTEKHIQIDTACLSADLRFTNYYMDLSLDVAPLSLSLGSEAQGSDTPLSASTSTQLFVDGVTIYGHRLFGLPPVEPTYLCNWDISAGPVTGECTAEFLLALANGGKAFIFTLDDEENALIPASALVLYDVTFLRVFVESVHIWLHVEEAAFLLSTDAIDIKFNDWANTHYSRRANINIPDIQFSCVNSEALLRHRARPQRVVEADAVVKTSVHLAIVGRKFNFTENRRLQQELLRREDQRTRRTDFLLLPELLGPHEPAILDPPAQPYPSVPPPTNREDIQDLGGDVSSFNSGRSSDGFRGLRHKSSFLSLESSSASSVVRARSSHRSSMSSRYQNQLRPLSTLDPRPTRRTSQRSKQRREISASTRHSAFYSAAGDYNERRDANHDTVAFSSQYFAPHFPLNNVVVDTSDTDFHSGATDADDDSGVETTEFNLGDIDPDMLSEDHTHTSIMLETPSGVTVLLNAASVRYIAALLGAIQPSEPEDILDNLQTSSITGILDLQKDQLSKGSIGEIVLRIPKADLRFVNPSNMDSHMSGSEEQDQYDFSMSKLALAFRTESSWTDAFEPESRESRHSFHARVGSVEVSASERPSNIDDVQCAVTARIENVLTSMGSKGFTNIDADVGLVQASAASEKIEYMASLIHRTNVLASDLGKLLMTTIQKEEQVVQYLVSVLAIQGHSAPDPGFLVRPSATLRSASQHVRTYDSWKLAMRLRQMWTKLDPQAREDLRVQCIGGQPKMPADARQQAFSYFQRWRSWDLDNLNQAILMNKVFGTPDETHSSTSASTNVPLMATIRVHQTKLAIDPGPKQNEILLLDLAAKLHRDVSDVVPRTAEATEPIPSTLLTVLNLYCGTAAVNLNWDLCELAEDVLKLFCQMRSDTVSEPSFDSEKTELGKALGSKKTDQAFHVVLEVEQGNVAIDTINLNGRSSGQGLKASLLMGHGRRGSSDTNFILSCDTISSRIRNHAELVTTFRLAQPSVFVSHELHATETINEHTIKVTASSDKLSLAIRQEPIALMEVLDTLIKDEVSQLYRLKHLLPTTSSPKSSAPPLSPTKKIADKLSSFRVNVAMFLNEYTISLPLLRSLTYNISGVVSRAAIAANSGRELIFDFDVKENSHDMQITINDRARSISLLQIPPTNGRITSLFGQGDNTTTVYASVELIQLDASAVYSLLSALNRPEISSTLNEIQEQVQIIKGHLEEVFEPEDGPNKDLIESPGQPKPSLFIYSIHLTFAGLEVFGDTPLKSAQEPVARLLFALDSIHVEVANRADQHSRVLENPEIHLSLRKVALEIRKGRPGAMAVCGSVAFGALVTATSRVLENGTEERNLNVKSNGFEVVLSPETVSTFVDVVGYMGDKIKDLDTSREREYLRKLRQNRPKIAINDEEEDDESDIIESFFSSMVYSFEIRDINVSWHVLGLREEPAPGKDDLVVSLQRIEFATRTRNSARLTIENLQVQMAPPTGDRRVRSSNSALLPEVVFSVAYVSTADARRLAFQAVGKSVDIRLTPGFIIPAANLGDSIGLSIKNIREASENWVPPPNQLDSVDEASPPPDPPPRARSILGSKRLESMLIDADFQGAVVHVSGKKSADEWASYQKQNRPSMGTKYGQSASDEPAGGSTELRTPGLALKVEYRDNGKEDPTLYAELRIQASSNILYPSVVPLIVDITNSVKEVVSDDSETQAQPPKPKAKLDTKEKLGQEDSILLSADPTAALGRIRLNLGLRICRQEFSLSCQPIARVAATASFEDIYFTINTVRSVDQGNFLAISGAMSKIQASVQHVYSRESTGSFEVDSMVLSMMNSKHVSGISGVSAILKVSPMKVAINAKQLQDFLLFREIWVPRDLKKAATETTSTDTSTTPVMAKLTTETSQGHLVQRYQQVAATTAFPWTATISISSLDISVDLGQAIGKSVFSIHEFWISSKKTSDWEQNLCLGFQRIGIDSTGRMSGFVAMQNFKLRTSIQWPEREQALNETPLVQASISFSQFRAKIAFDYQAFLVADITSMDFLMYNVRRSLEGGGDRLVASFNGDAVQAFGTTTSAAQAVALYQAFQKLVQERRTNFEASVREIEKFTRRRSSTVPEVVKRLTIPKKDDDGVSKSPISLDTDVVVTLKALNLGVFPSTFSDHQVFKMEALNAQARFAASAGGRDRRIHSMLGLTLGQLRIGLAGVRHVEAPRSVNELSVDDVVLSATGSRGGTILKVPKVEAVMQTWQAPESRHIDYIFKSAFEGKVEVGWNYSRISYIRGMWANHSKTLALASGKELALPAIKVTGIPGQDEEKKEATTARGGSASSAASEIANAMKSAAGSAVAAAAGKPEDTAESQGQTRSRRGSGSSQTNKITAEVHVPQSKYEYTPLEPPIIETPQLRDMGEATPPLEWIGLHRDRLPNLTHQIVIVSLLELAGEVEDAYKKILGSS
ncbi:hypothetical protein MCOR14_002982 [Pyricularia oryzae]|nr:hypothetical protein MCOR14_002982 [Pyricularia oryzae]